MEPLISIIMPVYNAEKRMRISIDSILAQTYKNFELILVDDGSRDLSPQICDEYSALDPRVKAIHQKNLRVSEARNTGIRNAVGEFISFVDADDILNANAYKEVMEILADYSIDIVMFGMSFDYYKKEVLKKRVIRSVEKSYNINKNELKTYFLTLYDNNYLSPVWNKVIRTKVIKENKISFENEMSLLEDFKFSLDVLDKVERISVLSKPLYEYYHDLEVSTLKRRPNIDFMRNFQILDQQLRYFAKKYELDEGVNGKKINGMIIRYYMIAIEKLFSSNENAQYKFNEMKRIIETKEFQRALQTDYITRGRLKSIYDLLKKGRYRRLFLIFFANDVVRK
ncbi:glycosyltransferase [Eubacteriaceae bacterium ES3]|nr:glycosyltransferase [Eubacteriaceae bacterium ES3]